MSIYTALIAEPGTGKSPAMKLVRQALLEIENHYKIESENSKLVNGMLNKTILLIIFFMFLHSLILKLLP